MKKRILPLLLAIVMLIGLLPTAAAETTDIPGSATFTYQGSDYALVLGHLENSGAVHVLLGNCGAGFQNANDFWKLDAVVSIFQNPGKPDMKEFKNLTSLITNVTFSATGNYASFGAVSAPNSSGTAEKDAYWTAPLTYTAGNGSGTLRAVVTLTIEGQAITKTLEIPYNVNIVQETVIDCTNPSTFPTTYKGTDKVDTMAELNDLIQNLQLHENDTSTTIVQLAPVTYYGILDLVSKTNTDSGRNLQIRGRETYNSELHAGCATIIVGGIRVGQHGRSISNLYLKKSETAAENVYDSKNRACGILTDGGEFSTVTNCVFEGYDIGLANQDGFIAPRSFLRFRDCGIGVQITSNAHGNFNSIAEDCKFTDCGIGMVVEGLPEYMPNYSFRVFNCDFLDNDMDIDCGIGRGYLYFYNNFYGKTNGDGDIVFRNAKGGKARVLTNPRWKAPICKETGVDQWVPEVLTGGTAAANLMGVSLMAEDSNAVTVEQSNNPNVTMDEVIVLNDLIYPQQLIITDPDFYQRTKSLQVQTILDSNNSTQELGTWMFHFPQDIPAAVTGTSPNFNPYLEVTNNGASTTVWVENSDCLSVLSPTLSIPCPADWQAVSVSFDGEPVESSFSDEVATFPVEAGGTYTITATKVAEQLKSANVMIGSGEVLTQTGGEKAPDTAELKLGYPFNTCRALGVVSSLGYRYLTEEDMAQITSSDETVFTVKYMGETDLGHGAFLFCSKGVGSASLQYTDKDGTVLKFPVTVTVPVSHMLPDNVTLAFGGYHDPDAADPQLLVLMNWDGAFYGSEYDLDGSYGSYTEHQIVRVRAGRPSDSLGYYDEAEDVNIQVEKLWIETLEGEEDTFSFSKDSLITEVTGQNDVQLYAKDGQTGRGRLWATVRIGDSRLTFACKLQYLPHMEADAKYFESLEALENYLKDPARNWVDRQVYRFYLKPGKHKGTLTMPEGLSGPFIYISGMPNGSTTIEGGIDLNGAGVVDISNISFVSPAGETTRALYNGRCGFVQNCSFYNYDVALESTEAGQIGALTGNLFVSNSTAVHIDIKKANLIGEAWMSKNTFINNDIAVAVQSMHVAINAFALRINESNFINNGTDFDLQHPGEYYFYRNYYGDYVEEVTPGRDANKNALQLDKVLQARSLNSLSKVLKSRPARTELGEGTMAFTNPRWAYPVIKWWHKDVLDEDAVYGGNELVSEMPAAVLMSEVTEEEEYVNYLTADWDSPTVIINEQADNLQLDTKAFAGADAVDIDVVSVDQSGTATPLGFWTFESEEVALAAADEASGTFHAGVTISIDMKKAVVTVQDSPVLRQKQPTFTTVAQFGRNHVHVVGPDNSVQEVTAQNGDLTVQVSCGGTYTVLPFAELAQFNQDGKTSVLTAEKFNGKKLLVAYYGEGSRFLGMAPIVTVDSSNLISIPDREDAKTIKVFLVDDLQNMIPLTEALPLQ